MVDKLTDCGQAMLFELPAHQRPCYWLRRITDEEQFGPPASSQCEEIDGFMQNRCNSIANTLELHHF